MLITTLTLILSFFFLLWAAHHLVIGASGIAHYYRIPPLFIGLTIVAIGTTAPEIMISIAAAAKGQTDLAIGNAIGSNIANIGFVLGLTALFHPLTMQSELLKREYPILFMVMLFAYALMIDGYLSQVDGLLLLLGSILLMCYFAYVSQKTKSSDPFIKEFQDALLTSRTIKANLFSAALGIILLPISASFLVNSASTIALWLGISPLIIGLTLIAVGTSLPELATSVVAAIKHEDDIAMGNILGSNIFNILIVMAFPGLIHPDQIHPLVLWRDIPIMVAFTLVLLLLNFNSKRELKRWHGMLLLMVYLSYLTTLAYTN